MAQVNKSFVQQVPGFGVVGVAGTAAEAEQMLNDLRPDLVILDLYLPDGSGLDLLRRLRSAGHTADVIIVTAAKESATIMQALRVGAVDYILKPYRFERFAEALTRYWDSWQQLSSVGEVEQDQVDRLLGRSVPALATGQLAADLPKGIDPFTLERMIAGLEAADRPLTAEDFGSRTGLSRTTARRYLEYLYTVHKAQVEVHYGDVGRPERLYSRLPTRQRQ